MIYILSLIFALGWVLAVKYYTEKMELRKTIIQLGIIRGMTLDEFYNNNACTKEEYTKAFYEINTKITEIKNRKNL